MATSEYDVVIIGAGPAGLAAGLYASRARRKTILIEKNVTGGQVAVTAVIQHALQALDLPLDALEPRGDAFDVVC